MPFDAYSFCPGGTGKKIKFCCSDLVSELEKISRMLEGDQQLACLKHIEQLQEKHPDRACLLAIKAMLLRATGNIEAAEANAAAFVEKHPDNPTALAESAMVTAIDQGGRAAVGILHRALAKSDGEISGRVYEAMVVTAQILLSEGEWLAGRALLQLQAAISRDDPGPAELMFELTHSPDVPLLMKADLPMASCPDDAPWKARFEEAMAPIQKGNWQAAADRLTALAEEIDDSPAIWQHLAMLRGWLADKSGCIEALRKFASLDVPLEDAVEAEALAMLSSDDPLGDLDEVRSLMWTIKDVEQLQAALSLESRALQIPFDRSSYRTDDSPAPKTACLLLDRPIPESAEDVTLDTVSRVLGQAMLYGRQTDREARLEVIGVAPEDLPQIKTLLGEVAGETLDADVQETVMAQVSASREMFHTRWRPPNGITPEQIDRLIDEHRRNVLLNRWTELKLGIFDGKSAHQAAGDPTRRIRLLAAIMVLEFWAERVPGRFDFNELRSELGLPTLDPIDPQEVSLESLPLVRLRRVMVEKASDEALLVGFRRSSAFGAGAALGKFARAVIDRSSLAGREEQLRAYRILAQTEEDPQRAIQYIMQGRDAAEAAGQSCAWWDLSELSFRFARGEGNQVQRLVQHIQQRHFEEPGVAESLTQIFVQLGILRPDGTPVPPPPVQQEPIIAAADQPEPEPGKLWTPDSQGPGGEKKLWTPD